MALAMALALAMAMAKDKRPPASHPWRAAMPPLPRNLGNDSEGNHGLGVQYSYVRTEWVGPFSLHTRKDIHAHTNSHSQLPELERLLYSDPKRFQTQFIDAEQKLS
mmetsp:Transcript_5928/g.14716  ORF Transcript_5928/g.14716 Transcript_5928/m.14716 type:complete len:106 (-) Transcript_5928:54-371(-)